VGLTQGTTKLTFNPDMETFFPESHPATALNSEIDETFLPTDNMVIAINGKGESIFNRDTLNLIENLTQKAWETPFSIRVDSLTNFSYVKSEDDDLIVEPFIENALYLDDKFLKEREQLVEDEESIYGFLISEDKETTIISIVIDPPQPNKELNLITTVEFILKFLEEARANHPELDIRLTGNPYQEYISPKMVQAEMPVVFPLMLFLIFISIFLLVRSLAAVISTFAVIFLAIGSTFGSIGLMGNALNQMVITFPILIITLALADCIHLFSIYFQQRTQGKTSEESMRRSLELNLQPLFLTTVTTCIGFLSFNILEVEPLRDLGNGISVGVFLAFVFTILFVAPVISFLKIKTPNATQTQTNFARKIAQLSLSRGKIFIWLVPAVCFLLISLIPLNELDDNPTQMYSDRYTSFGPDTLWLDEKLGVTFPVSFMADSKNGSVSNPDFLKSLDKFSIWLEEQDEVNHVTSLARTMKTLNKSMHGDDMSWKIIPDDQELSSQYLFFYEMSLPMGLDLNSSISQDRGSTKISATLKDMSGNEYLAFNEKVNAYLDKNGLSSIISEPAGFRVVFSHMNRVIVNSLLFGVAIGLTMITLIIGFFFRSRLFGFLSSFPNILPIGSAFGIWAILHGEVSFMVSVGMGSTLGIIVDFTVHLLSKYDLARTELGKNPEEAIYFSFESVGFALIVMTIVLSMGFAVLHMVNFIPLHHFAQFSIIAFIVALLIDFFLFPNLLVKFDKRNLTSFS
jgi:predicted RND superfamily exporter protein